MMQPRPYQLLQRLRDIFYLGLHGAVALTFLPTVLLGAFWVGGENMLIMLALGLPICLILARVLHPGGDHPGHRPAIAGNREDLQAALDLAMHNTAQAGRNTACILFELDDLPATQARLGSVETEELMVRVGEKLRAILCEHDIICRLEADQFCVITAPRQQLDLGDVLQLANRVLTALQDLYKLGDETVHVSLSVGMSLDVSLVQKTGTALLEAANVALCEARRHGPSGMRAYSREMQSPATHSDADLVAEVSEMLENGLIQPWFQPQISTDTGQVTGFEALARWTHPVRGVVPPPEFLPALEQAGRMERLGEIILYSALSALKAWDAAGQTVPLVGVNFSPEELRNPRLVEKIEWELDRFELPAHRLSVEILETVVASAADDTVVRNINALSRMGCRIELDDFGTGHASISSLRRFDVQRLKIDRSFVMEVDRDPQQRRMVSAILLMAERLELDTLAEGVETLGEHTILGQLGCGHVQGFGIGRPMPFNQTVDWIDAHQAKLATPHSIGRQIG